jgi:hypothetical protein
VLCTYLLAASAKTADLEDYFSEPEDIIEVPEYREPWICCQVPTLSSFAIFRFSWAWSGWPSMDEACFRRPALGQADRLLNVGIRATSDTQRSR